MYLGQKTKKILKDWRGTLKLYFLFDNEWKNTSQPFPPRDFFIQKFGNLTKISISKYRLTQDFKNILLQATTWVKSKVSGNKKWGSGC